MCLMLLFICLTSGLMIERWGFIFFCCYMSFFFLLDMYRIRQHTSTSHL